MKTNSVMSKEHVTCKVKLSQLLGMYDYEGKNESRSWTKAEGKAVLFQRTRSPPAKIIRIFLHKAADNVVEEVMGYKNKASPLDTTPGVVVGLTCDVRVTAIEARVDTRVAAAQADDTQVDLSIWALPNDTSEVAHAKKMSCNFLL